MTDQSTIAYTFEDGWSVRSVIRLEDQQREGELIGHCLRDIDAPRSNVWSLRDAENFPRLTFAGWRWSDEEEGIDLPFEPTDWIFAEFPRAVIVAHAPRRLLDEHEARLREFSNKCDALPPMPDSALVWLRELADRYGISTPFDKGVFRV